MIRPRLATLADAEAVTALLRASYGALLPAGYAPEVIAVALPRMTTANPALLGSGTWFVVDGEDGLLGCGGVTLEEPGTGRVQPGRAHLRHFATAPDAVRRGVGRALVRASADAAVQRGAWELEAWSTLVAEPFYASVGLIAIERFDVLLDEATPLPTVRMRGPLAAVLIATAR